MSTLTSTLTQPVPDRPRAIFTPGNEKTRSFSLKARHSGQRYGNFDNTGTLPHVGLAHVAGQHILPFFKNQQIYQKVLEWFESWRPWQQRILLCGLTNRSSTALLESLATTLEPVFHRDFTLDVRSVYPSTPFQTAPSERRVKAALKEKPHKGHAKGKSRRGAHSQNGRCKSNRSGHVKSPRSTREKHEQKPGQNASCEETKPGSVSPDPDDLQQVMTVEQILEEVDKQESRRKAEEELQDQMPPDVSPTLGEQQTLGTHEQFQQGVAALAEQMASDIMTEVGINVNRTVADIASDLVDTALSQALTVFGKEPSSDKHGGGDSLTSALGNLKPVRENSQDEEPHRKKKLTSKLSTRENLPSDSSTYKDLGDRLRDELVKTRSSPITGILQLMPDDCEQPASQHHNPWASHILPPTVHSCCVDGKSSHKHGSALPRRQVKSADFFLGELHGKLGPVQAELRTGRVNKPLYLSDTYLPLQNMYKHSKWFGEKPASGREFVQPTRSQLSRQFNSQIKQLWQWMECWEDHEKLYLLKELLKVCTTALLTYLTQCIFERLQERVDVNWLPDRLLLYVFSQLSFDDIFTCSQVCRRWRYLCAVDQLWMVKCHELGAELGITELANLVLDSSQGQKGVDWKLAYLELQRIAADAKDSVPFPLGKAMQRPPDGMKNYGHGFAPLTSEATMAPRKGLAAELARESERLKRGLSEGLPRAVARSRRRQEAEASDIMVTSQGSDVMVSQDSDVTCGTTAQPQCAGREMLSTIAETKSMAETGPMADTVSSLSLHPRLLRRSQDTRLSGLKPLPAEPSTAGGSVLATPAVAASAAEKAEKAESIALLQWIRGRGKKRSTDGEGEVALDVRPRLVQANDILGRSRSSCDLKWRSEDKVKDPRRRSAGRYAGSVKTVKRVRKLQGHMDGVLCLQFTKRRLVTGSLDRSARVWDVRSGRSVQKFYGHKGGVTCLLFDDADTLYTGSWDMSIMVWDLVYFNRKAVLTGHLGSVSCLKLTHKYLLSGSHDHTVRVWSRHGYVLMKTLQGHHSHILCMDTDGTRVITGSADKTIRITDIESEECLLVLTGSPEPVHKLILKSDLIISGDTKGRVLFWNRQSGEVEAMVQAHQNSVNALAFHEGRFFTASSDMTIKEWDLVTMTPVRSLQGHKAAILDFKINSERMVSCDSSGQVRVWDFTVPLVQTSDVCDLLNMQVINEGEEGGTL